MDSGQPLRGFRNDVERFWQTFTPEMDSGVNSVSCWSAMRRLARGLSRLLFVVVDLGELRVDDIVLRSAASRGSARRVGATRTCLVLLGLRVHRLTELHRGLRERIGLGLDVLGVVTLHGFLQGLKRILDRTPLGF